MKAQEVALGHVAARCHGPPLDPSLRVTVHFHPDRTYGCEPLLRVLARDGVYRSQFETGTSNGGLTAFEGGERWRWESGLFRGAYDNQAPAERPKYGALNTRRSPLGGSLRFGSAHFRLTESTQARTTFCYPDSVFGPEWFGVASAMGCIGHTHDAVRDVLDDYVEAHVHGPLRLREDVEALVLDPCFRDTEVEGDALRLGCAVEWHPGLRLRADVLRANPDYRGALAVELGAALARDGWLTAREIGVAVADGRVDRHVLKHVWHYVAAFGEPGAVGGMG